MFCRGIHREMVVSKLIWCLFVVMIVGPPMCAMGVASEIDERLERQETRIAELEARLNAHDTILQRLPLVDGPETASGLAASYQTDVDAVLYGSGAGDCSTHEAGYDGGFFISPVRPGAMPFALKLNGRIQFRHTAFDRQAHSYFN